MTDFLHKSANENSFELLIDADIFPKDIVLKAAYNYLDKGYFFFKYNSDKNIILQYKNKEGVDINPESIIWEFSDTLLETYLRDKLEKDNKVIRELIVEKAINGPLDTKNFVSFESTNNSQVNQVDFDKDIDDILAEIENDPDLKIDEDEIKDILAEIEDESNKIEKPTIQVNTSAVADLKKKFNK